MNSSQLIAVLAQFINSAHIVSIKIDAHTHTHTEHVMIYVWNISNLVVK